MSLLGYKLRRTFRLWDVVTIIGACVLITAPCIGAMFYLEEWTAPAGTLIAAPALAWLIAVLMFRARWQFWAPVEYVTKQGVAVRQFRPGEVLHYETVDGGTPRSFIRTRPASRQEITEVEQNVEAVVRFWTEVAYGTNIRSWLQAMGSDPGDSEARRVLRKAVVFWRQQPFQVQHWRWRDRWLSGLRKGERVQIGWKSNLWDTALAWELSGVLVNLVAGVWGEQETYDAIMNTGFGSGFERRR